MNIKELRVGNVIFTIIGDEVITIKSSDFEMIEDDFGIYEPIPLTVEWLEKLGFERNIYIKTRIRFEYWQRAWWYLLANIYKY